MWAGRLELPDNVHVYSVGKERGYSEARRAVEFYRLLFRLLRRHRYDACFSHMSELFAVMAGPVLRARRIPLTLWYAHGTVTPRLRLAERLVDRVVTSHPDSFQVSSPKLQAIGQAIDLEVFKPVPVEDRAARPFTVLAVGRIAPIKRVDVIVEGFARFVPKATGPVRLRLVGPIDDVDAAYAAELKNQARRLGVDHLVEFAGAAPRASLPAEYSAADVVVNLTVSGAFDKTALEAMACGTPLVSSNQGMVDEVTAVDSRLGLAEPPDPDQLASALAYVEGLGVDGRADLGRALCDRMRRHALSTFAARLLAAMPRRAPAGPVP
jgi:glycosyltransferase involved in cell wall biosynthesis